MSQTPISNQSSAVELGRLLAEKRNQKGMSLEDAAARLKLAPEKVRALEKGDYKGLPELVYVRGFLRNYARLVGMDVAELNRHLESATPVAKQDMSVLEQGPHQKELAHLENRKSFSGWIAGVLALVAVGGGIYVWQSKSIAQQERNAQDVHDLEHRIGPCVGLERDEHDAARSVHQFERQGDARLDRGQTRRMRQVISRRR